MVSLSDFSMWLSVFFGFCLGIVSVYVGITMLIPFCSKYQEWKYGFNHVFGDFFNCTRQSNICKRLFQWVTGLCQLVSGLLLCLGLITTSIHSLAYENYDYFNSLVACTSVILLTVDLTAYTVRRCLLSLTHNRNDLYVLCPIALAIGTIFFRFYTIPYETISRQRKREFICVSSVCILAFCWSVCCRFMTRASIPEIKAALAHFDDFTIHRKHGNNQKNDFTQDGQALE